MQLVEILRPDLFPMVRAGGLFILLVGAGVVLGGMFPRWHLAFLGVGAAGATTSIILFAARLSLPYGAPTSMQLGFLVASIVLEIVLIRVVVARTQAKGERPKELGILFVVGLHFLPMAVAFGPASAVLGVVLCAWSVAVLRIWHDLPLRWAWAVDGTLKVCFGALMFIGLG